MARKPILVWNGDEILRRVAEASAGAIDDVTEATDKDASANHWWKARTAPRGLVGQLTTTPAVLKDGRVSGSVGATYSGRKGVFSAFYGLFLERKLPWLRPAFDRNFPTLPEHMRRRLMRR